MPRTAPAVNGSPTFLQFSLHYIDSVGTMRSIPLTSTAARATNANIEAWANANSDISNANMYGVSVTSVYQATPDASSAVDQLVQSVKDHVIFSAYDPTDPTDSRGLYLPSPEESIFIAGTRDIDPTNVDVAALLTAGLAVLPAGYSITGATFNQNVQRGKKVKF